MTTIRLLLAVGARPGLGPLACGNGRDTGKFRAKSDIHAARPLWEDATKEMTQLQFGQEQKERIWIQEGAIRKAFPRN